MQNHRHVDAGEARLGPAYEAFKAAVIARNYRDAIAAAGAIRQPAEGHEAALADRILDGHYPQRHELADILRFQVFLGETLPAAAALHVADLLDGVKFGAPRKRKSIQRAEDVALIALIGEAFDGKLPADKRPPTKVQYAEALKGAYETAAGMAVDQLPDVLKVRGCPLGNGNKDSVKSAYRVAARRDSKRKSTEIKSADLVSLEKKSA